MQLAHRVPAVAGFWLTAIILGFFFGLLALAGCRSSAGRSPGAGSATEAAEKGDQGDPIVDNGEIGEVDEIVYELTGGFAGFQLKLTIDRGGAALVHDAGKLARRGQLTAEEWAEIKRMVASAKLAEIKGQHGRAGTVADGMSEVVTVRGEGRTLRVGTVTDPANEPPEGLRALNDRLRELANTLPRADG